jgi:DNA-binding LacI/PurR family transcriptional regulator
VRSFVKKFFYLFVRGVDVATIYDVGTRAGVSVATVSSVINNSSYVSPELRQRVEAAIRELNYSPNLLARGLARQKTLTLGVLVPDIANFFYPELVRGVEDKAKEAGYTIILGSSDNQLSKEEVYLELFLSKRVDGIVLIKAPGEMSASLEQNLKKSGPPIVLLDREHAALAADTVVADDFGGACLAIRHLLDLGHKRIGIIRGVSGASTTEDRFRGYQTTLEERHVALNPDQVAEGDYGIESGYAAGVALLRQKPTAVFVTNYMMTIGLLRAIEEQKLSCPKDISIVSYDDFIWSDVFPPRLTCVVQPKYMLGYKAAETLISRIQGKHKRPRKEVLDNRLQIRASSIALRSLSHR